MTKPQVTDEAVETALDIWMGEIWRKNQAPGLRRDMRRVLEQYEASRATPAPQGEPVAYRHEMTEPDDAQAPRYFYSASKNNPWSHWMQEHLDRCRYVGTPLYASAPAVPDPVDEEREACAKIADSEGWCGGGAITCGPTIAAKIRARNP